MSLMSTATESALEDMQKMGNGTAMNLGVIYQPRDNESLIVSAAMSYFGGTTINWDDDSSDSIRARLNLGVAWTPVRFYYYPGKFIRPHERLTFTAQVDNIGQEERFPKTLHLGAEYKFSVITLRVGFNSGWMCYGFKLLGFMEGAYYRKEVGSYAGADYVVRYYISLGF
jgi:hypothetical protein